MLRIVPGAAIAFAMLAPSAHAVVWSPPEPVTPPGGLYNSGTDIVGGPDGVVTAVFVTNNDDEATTVRSARSTGTGWSAPVPLSDPDLDAEDPRVAVTGDRAIVVWREEGGAIRSAQHDGKQWTIRAQPLSDPGENALDPRIAAGSDGTAIVVWRRSASPEAWMRSAHFSGSEWSPPVSISPEAGTVANPHLTVGTDGVATVVWTRVRDDKRVVQAVRGTGPSWGPVEDVSSPEQLADNPHVAVGPDGVPVVVWLAPGDIQGVVRASVRSGPTSAPWTASVQLSDDRAVNPKVVVRRSGEAVAVWSRSVDGAPRRIEARRGTSGAWSPLEHVSQGDGDELFDLAVGADDAVTALWNRQPSGAPSAVIAARLTSGWLPGERISSDGTDSVGGSLATRSDGSAVALWYAYDFATNDEGMYAALLGDPPPSPEPPPPPPATPPAAPEAPAPPPVTPAASQADSPPPVLPVAPGSDAIPAPFSCTLPRRPSALALPTGLSQLRINQSISVASIRRLNAIAARLDGRPAPRPRSGPRGTIRATTGQLRINQRIAEAGYTRARAIYQRLGGTGAPAVRSRARTIELNRAGVGLNQLTNIRALDMLNCITRNLS